ncbi:MAG: hypothetical protein QY314_04120 [Candidatus Dojkabacteria bacterium]|nr:MAG: hypothetical protein QY314_04120 [Candidatus Dojkabacteria bacterium]
MKPGIFTTTIGIVSLIAVNYMTQFFEFSKSLQFVILFLVIYSIGNVIVPRIRKFFLLPNVYWADLFIHAVINALVFYFAHTLWGGITVLPVNLSEMTFGVLSVNEISLDILGTILYGAIAVAALYEFILFTSKE